MASSLAHCRAGRSLLLAPARPRGPLRACCTASSGVDPPPRPPKPKHKSSAGLHVAGDVHLRIDTVHIHINQGSGRQEADQHSTQLEYAALMDLLRNTLTNSESKRQKADAKWQAEAEAQAVNEGRASEDGLQSMMAPDEAKGRPSLSGVYETLAANLAQPQTQFQDANVVHKKDEGDVGESHDGLESHLLLDLEVATAQSRHTEQEAEATAAVAREFERRVAQLQMEVEALTAQRDCLHFELMMSREQKQEEAALPQAPAQGAKPPGSSEASSSAVAVHIESDAGDETMPEPAAHACGGAEATGAVLAASDDVNGSVESASSAEAEQEALMAAEAGLPAKERQPAQAYAQEQGSAVAAKLEQAEKAEEGTAAPLTVTRPGLATVQASDGAGGAAAQAEAVPQDTPAPVAGMRFAVGTYVTAAPGYEHDDGAAAGPLAPGKFGLVLKDDGMQTPYLVVELTSNEEWWYKPLALNAAPREQVDMAMRRELPGRDVWPGKRVQSRVNTDRGMVTCVSTTNHLRVVWDDVRVSWTACDQVWLEGAMASTNAQLPEPMVPEEAASRVQGPQSVNMAYDAPTTADGQILVDSYVTLAADYKSAGYAAGGPLGPGKYGIVMKDDKTDVPLQVMELTSGKQYWYRRDALRLVTKEEAEQALSIKPLPDVTEASDKHMDAAGVHAGQRMQFIEAVDYFGATPGAWGEVADISNPNCFRVKWDSGNSCWVSRDQVRPAGETVNQDLASPAIEATQGEAPVALESSQSTPEQLSPKRHKNLEITHTYVPEVHANNNGNAPLNAARQAWSIPRIKWDENWVLEEKARLTSRERWTASMREVTPFPPARGLPTHMPGSKGRRPLFRRRGHLLCE